MSNGVRHSGKLKNVAIMKNKNKYTVEWGGGYSQGGLNISEAMKILRDLIKEYPSVTIKIA